MENSCAGKKEGFSGWAVENTDQGLVVQSSLAGLWLLLWQGDQLDLAGRCCPVMGVARASGDKARNPGLSSARFTDAWEAENWHLVMLPLPLSCSQICLASPRWCLNGQACYCKGTELCRATEKQVWSSVLPSAHKVLPVQPEPGDVVMLSGQVPASESPVPDWGLWRETDQKILELESAVPLLSSEIKGKLWCGFTGLKGCLLQAWLLEEFLIFIKFKISNEK